MLPDEHCPECHGEPALQFAGKVSLLWRCTYCGHEWRQERTTAPVPHKRTNKAVNITLPPWAHEKLKAYAERKGLTFSGAVQAMVARLPRSSPVE